MTWVTRLWTDIPCTTIHALKSHERSATVTIQGVACETVERLNLGRVKTPLLGRAPRGRKCVARLKSRPAQSKADLGKTDYTRGFPFWDPFPVALRNLLFTLLSVRSFILLLCSGRARNCYALNALVHENSPKSGPEGSAERPRSLEVSIFSASSYSYIAIAPKISYFIWKHLSEW